MDSYRKAKDVVKKFNQEHLLDFYDELNSNEQELLVNQILDIDFEQIFDLYEASKTDEEIAYDEIEPLTYTDKSELSKVDIINYSDIGEIYIRKGALAVVTLAGGQGTRLGFKGPKGCFELDIFPKKSLFEILCDQLKEANRKYNITIPWYIMTSDYNDKETKTFFEQRCYFGYPKHAVKFFKQGVLPLINTDADLILEELYKVKEASNGNGDVFEALERANLVEDMRKKGVKWVSFCGIDNVILDIVDPLFLGLTIAQKNEIASKTLYKNDVESKDWVFLRKKGMPSIISPSYLSNDMKTAKDDKGHDLYRDMNILAHLFSIDAIEHVVNVKLPYHRAFKKNPFVNEEGMKQVPESPNTFKFETFIFDAFAYFDDNTLLRVNKEDEFAPIKDFNGIYNPEVAKDMYEAKYEHLKIR